MSDTKKVINASNEMESAPEREVKTNKKIRTKVQVVVRDTTGVTVKFCAFIALILFVLNEFFALGIILPITICLFAMIFCNEVASLINFVHPFLAVAKKRMENKSAEMKKECQEIELDN